MAVLKAGTRLRSAVCTTEVMVVAAPKDDVDVRCGGEPLIPISEARDEAKSPSAPHDAGTQMGKRYVNEAGDLELLVSKPGDGSLSVGDAALAVKGAKPLPSSD
jgi:hypothetical protein